MLLAVASLLPSGDISTNRAGVFLWCIRCNARPVDTFQMMAPLSRKNEMPVTILWRCWEGPDHKP